MSDKSSVALLRNARVLQNALMERGAWLRSLLTSCRDIDKECGHLVSISMQDYTLANERRDVASRVVSILPEETWSQDPEVYETEETDLTEFETRWNDLNNRLSFWSHLQRIDVMSGVGRFGILLLGFNDGKPLDTPVESATELLYLRPLDESVLEVKELVSDPSDPRYGLPLFYEITFADTTGALGETMTQTISTSKKRVHWTRALHVADNRTNSEVFGIPRMKRVFDRLTDLNKIASGSAEMYWKGGFPGLSLQSQPNIQEEIEFDKEDTKEQMEAYMSGLQRYIATIGMEVKSLEVQVADPRPAVEAQLKLIAMCLSVPWRIFVGSESAHLASSQDDQTWNRRLTQRRNNYVNPCMIRPFVDRLIQFGILPKPKTYQVYWPDLNTPSETQQAEVAERKSNAISKYVQVGGDQLIDPYHYLTEILGIDEGVANAVIKAVGDSEPKLEVPGTDSGVPAPGANRNGGMTAKDLARNGK